MVARLADRQWQDWLGLVSRLVLAFVWIYAAVTKIGRPLTSARAVQAYDLMPFDVAAVVGQVLPIIELALGLLLLVGLFSRFSGIFSSALLIVFIIGIASAWVRGLEIDCGCFGGDGSLEAGRKPQYLQEILRDLVFLGFAGWLSWRPGSVFSVDARLDRGTTA
ncbi:MauE/DoxX family redox-associated membrane protein [Austwickia chelonae]|uniref:MauE/DoxX family redox-associated membrane protein n=1 Tax=Austwickia chelonae TaxID=100225 RepID=UPI000E228E4F|nr:MauE/DoxX family redox-associated membrane protein [Austwickia chelonae]